MAAAIATLIDEPKKAYVAGLVDGEGTITLTRLHANEGRRRVLSISSNELPLLAFVKNAFGVGKITKKRCAKPKHRPSYAYQVTSRQTLQILIQITPYLRSYKRYRAELAITEYLSVTPRNGRYTKDMTRTRSTFEQQLLGITAESIPVLSET